MNLFTLLARTARTHPDAPALALGAQTLHRYGAFAGRAASISQALQRDLGVRAGDRVAIVAKNCPEYLEVLFACWHAGVVAVPVNSKLHPKELQYIFDDCGARIAFVTSELATGIPASVDAIELASKDYDHLIARHSTSYVEPADAAPDTPAWIFYTSGTTGQPKGATLTHRNLLYMTFAYLADIDPLGLEDTFLHPAPLSHGAGLYALPHVACGSRNVIPESGGFEPTEILENIARNTKVSFFAAPTMVTRLLAAPEIGDANLSPLKTIIYGGAPMYLSDCLSAIDCFGPRLYNLFGQGESPMTITGLSKSVHADSDHPRYRERLASCGAPRMGVDLRIVDEEGRLLAPGEVGEVATRSDCVMAGYWNKPEASAEALRGGWLHTGDLGSLDDEGFLTLRDRSKDLIISGGSNIYPREIEEVILRDPRVLECSVVGRPHADWGEEVVAFVVPRPGEAIAEGELDALCLDNVARFKRPKDYRFVDSLPKNNYGKVLKRELRETFD
jgi:acyl-CoA synthetase (AMP-forming)/AMP-acid ligase II